MCIAENQGHHPSPVATPAPFVWHLFIVIFIYYAFKPHSFIGKLWTSNREFRSSTPGSTAPTLHPFASTLQQWALLSWWPAFLQWLKGTFLKFSLKWIQLYEITFWGSGFLYMQLMFSPYVYKLFRLKCSFHVYFWLWRSTDYNYKRISFQENRIQTFGKYLIRYLTLPAVTT